MNLDELFSSASPSVVLAIDIPAAIADDIEKASVYFSPDIERLSVNADRRGVTIVARPGADTETVLAKAHRAISSMVRVARDIPITVHYERENGKPIARRVDEELIQRRWMFEHADGQVSLAGAALKLLTTLDARLADAYRAAFNAVDQMYPAMVSPNLLHRVGYFSSHPNAASFVCHMVEDFDELEQFRAANGGAVFSAPAGGSITAPQRCLNPAACFPCYERLQGQIIDPAPLVLTWSGRVFRYESRNMRGLERLWEFNVRELVFIGSEAFTLQARQTMLKLLDELAREWDLACRVESATDAFFPTVYGPQSFWQRVKDVKYEFRLPIEPGENGKERTLAAGSINMHGPFFGEAFGIRLPDGEIASTACVGWGLERLVFALFSQHGFDPETWPNALRGIFS